MAKDSYSHVPTANSYLFSVCSYNIKNQIIDRKFLISLKSRLAKRTFALSSIYRTLTWKVFLDINKSKNLDRSKYFQTIVSAGLPGKIDIWLFRYILDLKVFKY
jgi:hypothetical protein